MSTALDAVVTIDSSGAITGWNRQAETVFGWQAGEVIGRLLADVVVPSRDRAAHRRGIERFLATGEGPILGKRIEIVALRRGEREFPVELTVQPLRLDDEISFVAFVRGAQGRGGRASPLRRGARDPHRDRPGDSQRTLRRRDRPVGGQAHPRAARG